MPKWIHDRAAHIRAKNSDMSEGMSWAVATQQAHAAGKSPRGYGTVKGKKTAKTKFNQPKKSYTRMADPKGIGAKQVKKELKATMTTKQATSKNIYNQMARLTRGSRHLGTDAKRYSTGRTYTKEIGQATSKRISKANAATNAANAADVRRARRGATASLDRKASILKQAMLNSPEMIRLESFREELVKIAKAGAIGGAVKRVGQLLAGGKRKDVTKTIEPGAVGKLFGAKSKDVVVEGAGGRAGNQLITSWKDPAQRSEALKSLAARSVVGGAAVAAGGAGVKKHRKTERKQLGRAYVAGARDMYSRVSRPRRRQ